MTAGRATSDCIHCGEPLEYVNEYGVQGWSSTDQQDMDCNGLHCAATDDEHQPYTADLPAVA